MNHRRPTRVCAQWTLVVSSSGDWKDKVRVTWRMATSKVSLYLVQSQAAFSLWPHMASLCAEALLPCLPIAWGPMTSTSDDSLKDLLGVWHVCIALREYCCRGEGRGLGPMLSTSSGDLGTELLEPVAHVKFKLLIFTQPPPRCLSEPPHGSWLPLGKMVSVPKHSHALALSVPEHSHALALASAIHSSAVCHDSG